MKTRGGHSRLLQASVWISLCCCGDRHREPSHGMGDLRSQTSLHLAFREGLGPSSFSVCRVCDARKGRAEEVGWEPGRSAAQATAAICSSGVARTVASFSKAHEYRIIVPYAHNSGNVLY